jgi:nicotinamidase-related amidase
MINKCILFIGIVLCNFIITFAQHSNQIGNKYLIVLDVQPQFYEDKWSDTSTTKLVQTINALVNKFNREKVIYIKSTGSALSVSFKRFSIDTLQVPILDSNLKVVNNNIFTKLDGNAFSSSKLISFLRNNNASDIVLVGLLAEKCIDKTAMGGKKKGFNMYVIPEAIIGSTTKSKEKAIKKMVDRGIKLLPVKELIENHID